MDPGLGPGVDFGLSGAGNPSLLRVRVPDPPKTLRRAVGARSVCVRPPMGVVWSHRLGGTKDSDLTQNLTCAPLLRRLLRILIVGRSRSWKIDGHAHERLGDTETSTLIEERSVEAQIVSLWGMGLCGPVVVMDIYAAGL